MAKEDIVVHQFDNLTAERQQAIASMGGKASVEARRKRKTIKEQMELLLSLPLKDEKARKQLENLGIDPDNVDNQMAMVIAQWRTALKGGMAGVNAFNSIQASVGEAPIDKKEITGNIPVVIEDDIKE
jgi:hypothetical protein